MTHLTNTLVARPRRLRPALAALAALSIATLALATASAAEATFPGTNGRIAYIRKEGANYAIFVKSASTGSDDVGTRVARGVDPDWSPGGGKLAFARDGDIYTIAPNGSGERRVTTSGGNSDPAWSHDGSRIAFTHIYDGSFADYDLDVRVVLSTGGPEGRVASSGDDEYDPTWSPDGTKVAYAHKRDTDFCICAGWDYGIFVRNADLSGSAERLGGAWKEYAADPDWSPDGSKIAYDGGDGIRIHTIGVAASPVFTGGRSPSWSPDGRMMTFDRGTLSYVRQGGAEYDVANGTSPDWAQGRPAPGLPN